MTLRKFLIFDFLLLITSPFINGQSLDYFIAPTTFILPQ